jgi:cell division protein FtsL
MDNLQEKLNLMNSQVNEDLNISSASNKDLAKTQKHLSKIKKIFWILFVNVVALLVFIIILLLTNFTNSNDTILFFIMIEGGTALLSAEFLSLYFLFNQKISSHITRNEKLGAKFVLAITPLVLLLYAIYDLWYSFRSWGGVYGIFTHELSWNVLIVIIGVSWLYVIIKAKQTIFNTINQLIPVNKNVYRFLIAPLIFISGFIIYVVPALGAVLLGFFISGGGWTGTYGVPLHRPKK